MIADNFFKEYNKEDSISSVSSNEELKEVITKTKESFTPKLEPTEITPYTFDPKEVIKKYDSPGKTNYPSTNYKPTTYSPSYSYGKKPKEVNTHKSKIFINSKSTKLDWSVLNEDVVDHKRTNEYKVYAKEFDKKYNNDQREIEQVTRDLNAKTNKIDGFIQELRNTNIDMILYKNRLVRDLEEAKNDLKEAYSNILLLINDRSTMKDQFCIYNVKLSKLKEFIRTYQEDTQM